MSIRSILASIIALVRLYSDSMVEIVRTCWDCVVCCIKKSLKEQDKKIARSPQNVRSEQWKSTQ